ncbi:DNA ligase D [Paraburkholderia caballeronis]|uniref:DNA ligase D n=1 Tax=Paraburkholderia caballeronis TaxID=416943 RepID=UPI001064D717|nr:DNA ligase D [Paraburkholderia caballeronis]TDV21037.1 bifunctional non-homologous end joining protein LigD [Paraburkholderia caballeronis]TDV21466.1 bifunctional non-homologous end joining protein LigD [Paraburkholderia caballeronis]TDV33505.1 bifunctional non-homologous end joining protein LigD [Paraburkholderia caballeronis]
MNRKLDTYQSMRRFDETPEPPGARAKRGSARAAHDLAFVIQRHDARRLHYDFRLELDGTLKSWAVPKGPSLDPSVKRLAVHVEDHPLEYGSFEGVIPEGSYGAGTVEIWDRGTWRPVGTLRDAREGYERGRLKFELDGEKLHGRWMLVRSRMDDTKQEQWLLIKERDENAVGQDEFDVVADGGPPVGRRRDGAAKRRPAGAKISNASNVSKASKAAGNGREVEANGAASAHVAQAGVAASTLRDPAAAASKRPARGKHAKEAPLAGAVRAPLPATLAPELATPADAPPAGDDWLYELKFDGYRVLARIERRGGKTDVRVLTRAGNDWTDRFRAQADALRELDVDSAWLDGEAVVLDAHGVPDFQALQNAFDANRPQDIVFYLFDLPYLNGDDLRGVPLEQRRARLGELMQATKSDALRFSDAFAGDPRQLLEAACEAGLEGLVAKRRDSDYTSTRSSAWLKLRCSRRQEFVIGGYTEPSGSRIGFGALLVGVYDGEGQLQYAGRVGTGFDNRLLDSLARELNARESRRMPFARKPPADARAPVHWVKPELVAECRFKTWTSDGIIRQASFVGLRRDKPAKEIVREQQGPAVKGKGNGSGRATREQPKRARASNASPKTSNDTLAGVRISHPDRVIDADSGTRKLDLARYFEWVAPWLLPHLQKRPVALVRAPDGVGGELFFQKHATRLDVPNVTQHAGLDPGHQPLVTIENVAALVGAAQMGTIELHTWNALVTSIEKPDRIVFDLDPDPSLGWDRMIDAARLTRELLHELGFESWCKTSGGKGLHVVVPLARHAGWDDAKDFAHAVADHMAATLPDRFSAKMGPRNREGRIFVDYLRNNRGASTIAAYAPRARPGLGVSVPIAWDELDRTTGGAQWTVANLHERLDALRSDPWAGYAQARQRITAAAKRRLRGA